MKSDFADWLSPMLVKELRQGMRARVFVGSFLLLQAGMMFNAVFGLLASSQHLDTDFSGGFFWTVVGIFVMFIMPLSGLGAIANEHRANTLELIFLTRLTARRIIFGKWLALVAQTALIVCAVLPYAVLRYFLGGVNLTSDLLMLGLMLLVSALLSGIAVGFSPYQSKAGRVFVTIGLVIGLQSLAPVLALVSFRSGPVAGGPIFDWRFYVGSAALGLLLLVLGLEFGSSKIAPPSENHSTPKRLVGLLMVLVAVWGAGSSAASAGLIVIATVLVVPLCMGALAESLPEIPSVYRPFVRRGLVGQLAGRLLYPGWPTGLLYTCIAIALAAAGPYVHGNLDWSGSIEQQRLVIIFVALAGALLLPPALMRAFLPDFRHPLAFSFIFHGACSVLLVLAVVIDQISKTHLLRVAGLLPACTVFLGITQKIEDSDALMFFGVNECTAAASLLVLVAISRPQWAKIRLLESKARTQLEQHAA